MGCLMDPNQVDYGQHYGGMSYLCRGTHFLINDTFSDRCYSGYYPLASLELLGQMTSGLQKVMGK